MAHFPAHGEDGITSGGPLGDVRDMLPGEYFDVGFLGEQVGRLIDPSRWAELPRGDGMSFQQGQNNTGGQIAGGAAGLAGLIGGGGGGGKKSKKPRNSAGRIGNSIAKFAFGGRRNRAAREAAGSYLRDRLPLTTGEATGFDVYNRLLAPQLADTTNRLFASRDQFQPVFDRIAGGQMVMPDIDPYVKLASRTYQNMVRPAIAGQFAQDNAFFSDLHGNTSNRAAQDMSTELGARALDLAPQNTALTLQALQGMGSYITDPIRQGTGAVGNIFQTGLGGRSLIEGTRTGAQPLVPSVFDPSGSFTGLANIPQLYGPPSSGGGGAGLLSGLSDLVSMTNQGTNQGGG